jgi:branched-chain amino acid transport system ATP-binding protein
VALLDVDGLRAGYGGVEVVYGIDFEVEQGETAVFLGLNGAAKTTTMMCIAGLHRPSGGTITFDGEDITGTDARKLVPKGITLVPEGRRIFPALSVERNLQIGAWTKRRDSGFVSQRRDEVYGYFPRLEERRGQLAGTLSGGEQQMLAIARGLMSDPKLLMIDEASLGLAPVIVQNLLKIIRQVNESGVTVLLVEQNISALDYADRAFVMEKGTIVLEAKGKQLQQKDKLREAFLGAA